MPADAPPPVPADAPPPADPALIASVRSAVGRSALSPLWSAVRERLEAGHAVSRIRVGPLDADQQAALADLFGLPRLPGEFTQVKLDQLDQLLMAVTGLDSRAVVQILGGPLVDRAAARTADREERRALWQWLEDHQLVRSEPALGGWVARIRRAGVADGSVPKTRRQLERALAVLAALPADGVPLSTFAESTCGDEHGLNDGTRLSNLVLHALAALHDEPEPIGAEERRRLWERAGVACDALSTSVLVAGMRPNGDAALPTVLRMWAEAGMACVVTLDQIRGAGKLDLGADTVWAVENPAVLAIATSRFSVACPPIICTSGWPNSAVITLMRRLCETGSELRYHGDFDGEGLRIAAYVCDKVDAVPWRMTTADYEAAVAATGRDPGRVTDVPWDPQLAQALRERKVSVPEERVAPDLLADLVSARVGEKG